MQALLSKIDELARNLQTLKPLKPERQSKLDKKFRLEYNYNSNHLEGNTLTYSETELLLIFDQTKNNHLLREYEEMKAHDVAFELVREWATNKERPLNETDIKNLNEIILVKPFWKEAITPDGQTTRRQIKVGDYKEFPNSVRLSNGEIFEYASVTDTPIMMGELMQWYQQQEQNKELHPVTLAASLHYKLVRIHPFDDGNGRISRLLMNYVLLKNDLPPVIIKSADKRNYLAALNSADTGDLNAFVKYIAGQLIWSLEISLKAAKGENIDEPDDLDKRIALLEKDLQVIDPDEEVKLKFSKEVFVNIYHTWFSDLVRKAVPAIQKFNRFFTGTTHSINLPGGQGNIQFVDESADEILEKLFADFEKNSQYFANAYSTRIAFNTFYGTLIKGGLKTFGCNYSIEIKFEQIKYEVWVDEFSESGERKPFQLFERLLHKPLTDVDIKHIVEKLSNAIYEHIDFYTKKSGLR